MPGVNPLPGWESGGLQATVGMNIAYILYDVPLSVEDIP